MTLIQPRRGTAAQWTSANPTLAMGELGFETDTKKTKRGDGVTAWTALAYDSSGATTWATIDRPTVVAGGSDAAAARASIGADRGAVDLRAEWASIRNGQWQTNTGATFTSGLSTLTNTATPFTAADVGKVVIVGESVSGGFQQKWMATILSVSAGVATLNAAAPSSASGQRMHWGFDCTTAINSALASIADGTPMEAYLAGNYRASQIVIPFGVTLRGSGWGSYGGDVLPASTAIKQIPGSQKSLIVFENYGTCTLTGLTHMNLFGPEPNVRSATTTIGSGVSFRDAAGTGLTPEDGCEYSFIQAAYFPENGFEIPSGCFPLTMNNCRAFYNGKYGWDYDGINAGKTQALHLMNCSADGNVLGGARFKNVTDSGSIAVTAFKAEATTSAAYGTQTDWSRISGWAGVGDTQMSALIFEECDQSAVVVNGVSQIYGAGARGPGPAIHIKSATTKKPRIVFNAIGVRVTGSEVGSIADSVTLRDQISTIDIPRTEASGRYPFPKLQSIPGFDVATNSRTVLMSQESGLAQAPNLGAAGVKRVITAEAYGRGVLENVWYAGGFGESAARTAFVEDGGKIRIYLDSTAAPAVDMRINDFFCYGGRGGPFATERVGRVRRTGASSAYRNLYAPFNSYMRVEWENVTAALSTGFFTSAQYKLDDNNVVPRAYPTYKIVSAKTAAAALSNFTVADFDGSGQIESIYIAFDSTQNAEMTYLEGNPRIYVDGEAASSITSSGTEDFFQGGWYSIPVGGYPLGRADDSDLSGTHHALYRFFPKDPIRFRSHLKVVFPVGQPLQGAITPATIDVSGSVGVWLDTAPTPSYPSVTTGSPLLVDTLSYTAGAIPSGSWWVGAGQAAATSTGTSITFPYGTGATYQDIRLGRKSVTLPSNYWVEAKLRITDSTDAEQIAGIIPTSASASDPYYSSCTHIYVRRRTTVNDWTIVARDVYDTVNEVRIGNGQDLTNTWIWVAARVRGTEVTAYYKMDGETDWHPVVAWTASSAARGGGTFGIYVWTAAAEFDQLNVYPAT